MTNPPVLPSHASVAAAAPAKPVKSSGPKFYPPPPPPLPGRAAVAKPVQPQGRDIVVVDVPAARDSSTLVGGRRYRSCVGTPTGSGGASRGG